MVLFFNYVYMYFFYTGKILYICSDADAVVHIITLCLSFFSPPPTTHWLILITLLMCTVEHARGGSTNERKVKTAAAVEKCGRPLYKLGSKIGAI